MDSLPAEARPAPLLRILLVEDSEDDARLLAAELAAAGRNTRLRRVQGPDEMRRAMEESDWDVVISDHQIPRFSSLEAFRLLREIGRDVPFIVYSGTLSEQAAAAVLRAGIHDCVPKGNAARLIPIIERELRNARERRAKLRAESRLFTLAYFDELTGLPNRHLFIEQLREALDRQGGEEPFAVMFIDIDRFMRVNETYGHRVGDGVLKQAAGRLARSLGERSFLARLRSDEFGVFMPCRGRREAVDAAQRFLGAFAKPFVHGHAEMALGASIGISMFPDDGSDPEVLLNNAETAMSLAKRNWGNNCKCYARELSESAALRMCIESLLRHAVERGELQLEYQPIAELSSSRPVGAEALLRWRSSALGTVPPDRFIPVADETGLITTVGAWVLHEACRQARAWHDQGFEGFTVSVNLSPVQLAQPQIAEQIAAVLDCTGLPPRCLTLEITESVLMRDPEASVRTLHELREMGVRLSVDDFGTGYSSLSYLKRFPVDVLKIDKSFIRDIPEDGESAAIARAITALAHSLRLSVVAEGVENAAQAEFLRTIGCDGLQGYHFSRPLAPARMSRFISVCREIE